MEIDLNAPCPMEYYAAREWRAMREGVPPTPEFGVPYAIPTEYHERMAYFEKYRKAKEQF